MLRQFCDYLTQLRRLRRDSFNIEDAHALEDQSEFVESAGHVNAVSIAQELSMVQKTIWYNLNKATNTTRVSAKNLMDLLWAPLLRLNS